MRIVVSALCGSRAPERHGAGRAGEQSRSVFDNALAQRLLGWHPQVSLEPGLRETVGFFRAKAAA